MEREHHEEGDEKLFVSARNSDQVNFSHEGNDPFAAGTLRRPKEANSRYVSRRRKKKKSTSSTSVLEHDNILPGVFGIH